MRNRERPKFDVRVFLGDEKVEDLSKLIIQNKSIDRITDNIIERETYELDGNFCHDDGDYRYVLQIGNSGTDKSGWRVETIDKTKVEYGEIKAELFGLPILDMSKTFENCTNMKKSPEIPASVLNFEATYKNCYSLIDVPDMSNVKYVNNTLNTFENCISLTDISKNTIKWSFLYDDMFKGCDNITKFLFIDKTSDDYNNKLNFIEKAFEHCSCPFKQSIQKELNDWINYYQSGQFEKDNYTKYLEDLLSTDDDNLEPDVYTIKNLYAQNKELSARIEVMEQFISKPEIQKQWHQFLNGKELSKPESDIFNARADFLNEH